MTNASFDVANHIRMTQELQCRMLSLISEFFNAMQQNASKTSQTEILADLEITIQLMAMRLGIDKQRLEQKAVMMLKADLVKPENKAWENDLLTVLHRLEKS